MTALPAATTDSHIKINEILDIEGQPIVTGSADCTYRLLILIHEIRN